MGSTGENKVSGSLLLAWQVKDKHCLVIGGGDVALSRIHHLIRAQAKITVIGGISEAGINPEIVRLYKEGHILRLEERNYESTDLTMYETSKILLAGQNPVLHDLISTKHYSEIDEQVKNEVFATVCCCIDDYELSTRIYYQCKFLRLPVNIADKPPMCDFYFGSMFNQDNLQIMISTNGKSPRLLKLIKDNIAKQFEGIDLNKAVENLGLIRSRLRETVVIDNDLVSIDTRMSWIKKLTDFFTLSQWSSLQLIEGDDKYHRVDKIIKYFPDYPPQEFEQFKLVLYT